MCLPRFVGAVCCCSLRNATLFAAWIFTISSLLGTAAFTWASTQLQRPSYVEEEKPSLEDTIIIIYVVVALFTMFLCIFNFLLLLGIYKKNTGLMIPWLLLFGSCITIVIVADLLNFHVFKFRYQGQFLTVNYESLIIYLVILSFLLVYSHYEDVREQKLATRQRFYL